MVFGCGDEYSSVCVLSVSLSRTFLALLDWLSYNWLLLQLHSPDNEFKLVITLIHEHDVIDRKQ